MTGKRGPISGASFGRTAGKPGDPERQKRLGNPSHSARAGGTKAAVVPIGQPAADVPEPPAYFGVLGNEIWAAIHRSMPVLQPVLDRHVVIRYCEAAEDAVRARIEIQQRGLVIDEPIPDPRGGVAGYRAVINPAEAALRRADKVMTELGDRLGLSPAARARLGLTISQAELADAEGRRILAGMFRSPLIDIEEEDDDA